MTPALKKICYAGIPVYVALLVLSAVYYKEKAFFLDNAYMVFNLLKEGHINIYHFRFIELFAGSMPWLAMKLNAPLNIILLTYALAFWTYQLVCYLVCIWLRQYSIALIHLLVSVLFISEDFYTFISELPQAISLLFVLYAYIMSGRGQGRPVFYVVCAALLITISFSHLLVCFPLAYMVLFFYFRRGQGLSKRVLVSISVAYVLIIILKTIFFREPYEQHSMGGLKHFITLFPNYFSAYSFQRFFAFLGGRYIWITLLSAVVTAYYITRSNWLYAGLFLVSMSGYTMLVNICYPDTNTDAFYIENLYNPLAVFVVVPFVFDILPVLVQRRQALPVVLLITLTGVVRMWHMHTPYTARLQWQRNFIRDHAGKKLLVDVTAVPMDTLLMNWGAPYEFALLSSSETPHTESFTIADTVEHLRWAAGERRKLVTQWGNLDYSSFPARYFHFSDTLSVYTVVK